MPPKPLASGGATGLGQLSTAAQTIHQFMVDHGQRGLTSAELTEVGSTRLGFTEKPVFLAALNELNRAKLLKMGKDSNGTPTFTAVTKEYAQRFGTV